MTSLESLSASASASPRRSGVDPYYRDSRPNEDGVEYETSTPALGHLYSLDDADGDDDDGMLSYKSPPSESPSFRAQETELERIHTQSESSVCFIESDDEMIDLPESPLYSAQEATSSELNITPGLEFVSVLSEHELSISGWE